MFKSQQRPIVVPQWEHQKLAGTLALLWGNADFDRPPVAFDSFVTGVGLHDRAYGPQDALAIGELPEAEWLELTRRGFAMSWADPAADAIAKMHLARLVRYGESPLRQAAAAEMAAAIHELLRHHGLDPVVFERIDRITNLCDRIAFDFCFESLSEGAVAIFARNERDAEVTVRYRVAGRAIHVDPWPFAVEHHAGYLVGYQLEAYPHVLEPVLLPYQLLPGRG